MSQDHQQGVVGRVRRASVSVADTMMNFNPQPGMWAATGTAIAYAPTIEELRQPVAGGENVEFTAHGHSARTVTTGPQSEAMLFKTPTYTAEVPLAPVKTSNTAGGHQQPDGPSLAALTDSPKKHGWGTTIVHGLHAFWKFFCTPTGFLMTIYGLNIVGWGAMLFFLLLKAAPAMNHPSADDDYSARKIWLEIDSQILNALFCVTGFGLAPWRFRDLWYLTQVRLRKSPKAMQRLASQNASWFRPPVWYVSEAPNDSEELKRSNTFTGNTAPPTSLWKLDFVVWMMVLNTAFQAVLAAMMWGYNRFDRPSWSTGTFIALGCGVSLLAGLMTWWEGRKVKKIEGPVLKFVEPSESSESKGSAV